MTQNRRFFRTRAAAAVVMTAATAVVVTAQPASASSHRPCTIVKHSNASDVTKVAGGTATVGADGVKLTTRPAQNPDKVSWKTMFSRPVAANTVEEMNYETIKLDEAGAGVSDAALPAYHIYVKTPAGEGTLVYEPYFYLSQKLHYPGTPQRNLRTEWDVMAGNLWTPSSTITGLAPTAGGEPLKTFQEVVAANPRMTVTGIGFGLGTYNPGTVAVVDDQRFATKSNCDEHQWSTGFKSGGSWWPGWLRWKF